MKILYTYSLYRCIVRRKYQNASQLRSILISDDQTKNREVVYYNLHKFVHQVRPVLKSESTAYVYSLNMVRSSEHDLQEHFYVMRVILALCVKSLCNLMAKLGLPTVQ